MFADELVTAGFPNQPSGEVWQSEGDGLVRVDVASLTEYLGRIVRGERD